MAENSQSPLSAGRIPSRSGDARPLNRPEAIVGIGFDASGLGLVQRFFAAIPSTAMAYILVGNHDKNRLGSSPMALQLPTTMPTRLAENGTKIEAGTIYSLPCDTAMVVTKNRFVAYVEHEDDLTVPPFELILHSLAVSFGSDAIAILMAGDSDDGHRGAISIKHAGGLVLVEETSKPDTPDALIDAELTSIRARPEAMPKLILQARPADETSSASAPNGASEDTPLGSIFGLLRRRFRLDAWLYQRSVVMRRLKRRADLADADGIGAYAALLQEDDRELERLHDDLAGGGGAFFHDPDMFSVLAAKVLPALTNQREPIRIWIPACATGEEAYSVAMLFAHHLKTHDLRADFDIMATDTSSRSLALAKLGSYGHDQLSHLPADLRHRYLEPMDGCFRIADTIRDHIHFQAHDLIADPPSADRDLICCRNLLHHLTAEAQFGAVAHCRQALSGTGFLVLGPGPLPGSLTEGLGVVDQRWRIYRKMAKRPSEPTIRHFPEAFRARTAETLQPAGQAMSDSAKQRPVLLDGDDDSGALDGLLQHNQQMLESTIDTLLASNDLLRRRNKDLRQANDRLSTANAALDDMATLVAHDLRTPLLVVDRIAAALGTVDGQHVDWRQGCHQIRGHIKRLCQLIEDLVAYARQDLDGPAEIMKLDLGDVIREVLDLIGLPPGVKLEVRPPSLAIRTRRVPFTCVLRNLLTCIMDRHQVDAGPIRIGITQRDTALHLRITADGLVMDADQEGLSFAIAQQLTLSEGGHVSLVSGDRQTGDELRLIWPVTDPTPSCANC